jgi:hypothetical protein
MPQKKKIKLTPSDKLEIGSNAALGGAQGAVIGSSIQKLASMKHGLDAYAIHTDITNKLKNADKLGVNISHMKPEFTKAYAKLSKIANRDKRLKLIAPIVGGVGLAGIGGLSKMLALKGKEGELKKKYLTMGKHMSTKNYEKEMKARNESTEIMHHPHIVDATYETIKNIKTPAVGSKFKIPLIIGGGVLAAGAGGLALHNALKKKKKDIREYIQNF